MASRIEDFLSPLSIDVAKIHNLARNLSATFTELAVESHAQFLPTLVTEDILRPIKEGKGKFLAIDIGGTNLRVGFIELSRSSDSPLPTHITKINSQQDEPPSEVSRVLRYKDLERAWPIQEHLKQDKAEDLYTWIGKCIAEVVQDGCRVWPDQFKDHVPLGISFSFPMIQKSLSDAKIMAMGKGFNITTNSDLGALLQSGYDLARAACSSIPPIRIIAITNDAVATLISFTYQYRKSSKRKAAMGLIAGTGSNATIPLAISKLHPSKQPSSLPLSTKITINTEWTIAGASQPLHDLGFFTSWDQILDSECEAPGFQPFEYMTSGRYLGELGRIILHDYFTNHLSIPVGTLPEKLTRRIGLTTSFLGNLGPHLAEREGEADLVKQLEKELPSTHPDFSWTPALANVVFAVAKAVQVRAAGLTAGAVVGLLDCAGDITMSLSSPHQDGTRNHRDSTAEIEELMVGYTGGCIVHFQDYLSDCQTFLDQIMAAEFGPERKVPRVVLMPCHDGGILGAGILAGTVQAMA